MCPTAYVAKGGEAGLRAACARCRFLRLSAEAASRRICLHRPEYTRTMDLPLYWIAIIAFVIINLMLLSAAVLLYAERKVAGFIQERPGPNRVGPGGFLQPFSDVLYLVMKEDITPPVALGRVTA